MDIEAEHIRAEAEGVRLRQELARQAAERARVAAEEARAMAEQGRCTAANEVTKTVATLTTLLDRMEAVEEMRRASRGIV